MVLHGDKMQGFRIFMRNELCNSKIIISIIIPIRVTSFRKDILTRLNFCFSPGIGHIEYIIVDDGSSEQDAALLQQKCFEFGLQYISTNVNGNSAFNLARARNKGAQQATGKYIFFMDVDLLAYRGFYDDLLTEILVFDLEHNSDIFLMIPVVYLNQVGMKKYFEIDEKLRKSFITHILMKGDFELIEKYSHGTSCILIDRFYYLAIGGQNENYEGWGYEDYEFTTRLIKLLKLFPKPNNYESMDGNFMTLNRYEGWKSEYKLFGSWMARKGIYLVHAPHPQDSKYRVHQDKNLELFKKSLTGNLEHSDLRSILPGTKKSLLLSKNPFCYHYKLNALLGDYCIYDATETKEWRDILDFFENNHFAQIIFPNPYGNPVFLELYNYCKQNSINFIVCERGAFPDSVYHDRNGFLYDSSSYDPSNWDYPISEEQILKAKSYLSKLEKGEFTLEKQPSRNSERSTLDSLDIRSRNKKRVLIILQTQNDTVIKFFGKDFTTQQSLLFFLENLVKLNNGTCVFIYKNHPLENSPLMISHAINADKFHINDLIDVSDAVLTVNSGAGLISALLGKPVFTLGHCWYSLPGIACPVNDESDFVAGLDTFKPDIEKILRFTYYLRFKFYSFGKQHTVVHTIEGKKVSATKSIDYYEVQTFDNERVYFKDPAYEIGFNSLLFKEFETSSLLKKNSLAKMIVNLLNKNKKFRKFNRNPEAYYRDSKYILIRRIGEIIYGKQESK